ncbi:HAD family hydrolase [Candidatus Phytoplasma sp. AldY-WA1]|uniref:HAD family hydrolase n=1 Tax=Candidatus Phytoplasma sp. AldY-WA1 TaxID=2852100 RepID=UPI002550279C|nr:HAD family hydrolase [Candidatus Phytoplasma sp. AldY-WA1]
MKKRLFFFDIDDTLYCNEKKRVLPQTKKLIKELFHTPNTILGIATGRNHDNLDVISDLLPYFKYLVLINGALVLEDDQIIDENPIPVDYIEKFLEGVKLYSQYKLVGAAISMDKSSFFYQDQLHQMEIIKCWQTKYNISIDNEFYLKEKIFMLNLFGDEQRKMKSFLDELDCFEAYYWSSHVDLTIKNINKFHGINKIKEKYNDYEIICVGDGCNDKEMLERADIGIAMGNCEYEEVRKKANLISDHIVDDKMYDFFKKHNLV